MDKFRRGEGSRKGKGEEKVRSTRGYGKRRQRAVGEEEDRMSSFGDVEVK